MNDVARTGASARRRAWRPRLEPRALLVTLGVPAFITLLAFFDTRPAVPGMLYLVAIAVAALSCGRGAAVASAIVSFVAFDALFTRRDETYSAVDIAAAGATFVAAGLVLGELMGRQSELRKRAEIEVWRSARLRSATEALAGALTPQDVLNAIVEEGIQAVEAHAGLIVLLDEVAGELEVVAQTGYGASVIEERAHFPLAAPLPFSEAVRTRQPLFISSRDELVARYPEAAGLSGPGGAVAVVPLIVDDRVIGAMGLAFANDQEFDAGRREFKLTLARQATLALERARLYEAEYALRERVAFLAEASGMLGSSLDVERTLERVAELAVPRLADWCTIDMVGIDGAIERLVVVHKDDAKVELAADLRRRYPPHPDAPSGVPRVIRTGEPDFLPEITDALLIQAAAGDEVLLELLRGLGLRSSICVPIAGRSGATGALSLVVVESGRRYSTTDLELAVELGRRAGAAIENARLYSESERRAEAARALAYVGDGVILLDREGFVRHWNQAAVQITGIGEWEALGSRAVDTVPGWRVIADQVQPAQAAADDVPRPVTLPLAREGQERWVSVSAVEFEDGSVYALRDVTEERALERTRSDFVATASHELRTPLAAVYGAARTLRRPDLALSPDEQEQFLMMIEQESERLTRLVAQILLAGRLDAGEVTLETGTCDLIALANDVVRAARAYAPEGIELRVDAAEGTQPILCDEDKLRQVLVNLVDNAIKYSPEGGEVVVAASEHRLEVRDRGLGVPAAERERIFEKFYRLDPSLTKGVGGSGLGLYISRELVQRLGGRLTVDANPGGGSRFRVDLS